jgi:hypothetical protein
MLVEMHVGLRVSCPLWLSDFNQTWKLLVKLRNIRQYQV